MFGIIVSLGIGFEDNMPTLLICISRFNGPGFDQQVGTKSVPGVFYSKILRVAQFLEVGDI